MEKRNDANTLTLETILLLNYFGVTFDINDGKIVNVYFE